MIAAFEDPTSADAAKVGDAVDSIQKYDEDNCDVEYQSSSELLRTPDDA